MLVLYNHSEKFISYLKFEKRYSPHTLLAYTTDLRDFFEYIEGQYGADTKPEEISYGMIRSWLAKLNEDGVTAKTINRKISTLKSFYKFLLKNEVVTQNPLTKIISPKISKRLPVFVKEADIEVVTHAVKANAESWKELNAQVILTLLYATGMRLSELVHLKEQQVDFARKQVKVLGKGNKERLIPVHADVLDIIQRYITHKRKETGGELPQLLVTEKGKPLYPKYVYLLVRKHLSDIPTLDKKSPHVLRHTFATHLMNNGAELNAVKELLGHASLAATQVYTHNTIEKLKDVYKKAHPKS